MRDAIMFRSVTTMHWMKKKCCRKRKARKNLTFLMNDTKAEAPEAGHEKRTDVDLS